VTKMYLIYNKIINECEEQYLDYYMGSVKSILSSIKHLFNRMIGDKLSLGTFNS